MKPCSAYDLQGHALPKGGVAEDVLQMGGDFIVARDGRCEFICVSVGGVGGGAGGNLNVTYSPRRLHSAFASKTSLDRPTVEQLLRSARAGL
jgi:hypothetical protein